MSGKSLAKAFFIGLVIYIGLNFVLYLLYRVVVGDMDTYFTELTNNPIGILLTLFGPIVQSPYTAIWGMVNIADGGTIAVLMLGLAYLVPGILAAVVSARFNESRYESFGGWFLIAIVSFVMVAIYSILEYSPAVLTTAIVLASAGLLTNLVFYGFFACVTSKSEIY